MKRLFATIAAIAPLVVAAPLSAHHPAADIVSEEIYDTIEQNLLDADSPHLDLDLTDIMDPDDTVVGMEITVTLPQGLEPQVVDIVSDVLMGVLSGQGAQTGSFDELPSVDLSIDYNPQDVPNGFITITITITEVAGGAGARQGGAA